MSSSKVFFGEMIIFSFQCRILENIFRIECDIGAYSRCTVAKKKKKRQFLLLECKSFIQQPKHYDWAHFITSIELHYVEKLYRILKKKPITVV